MPGLLRGDALLETCRDHLDDVASADRDALFDQAQSPCFRLDLVRKRFEFFRPHHERGQVEAEGELDLPSPALAGVALPIGTVASDDQPSVDQSRQMTPERCHRHAVRPQSELVVRGEDNQPLARQDGFRMKRQQRV